CGFEHYGWNYYSLKQAMDMALDILRTSQLLKSEKLESTDLELYAYFMKKNKFNYNSDCTEDYRRIFVKTDLVDFFKRLSIRLRNMVGNAPEGYKYICIEGP
ncbi:MAG: hypothetical protein LBL93_03460, partial [Ruminococcus sp.]|nr:hypothetical protein [Ruminococcus sp.]